jgi:glycosyltransferase involved in cell wall biosynthesis
VIATDVGEVSRFIKDGKTGYVVNRGADHLIAEKIIWVLENPEHAKEMGERARAVALMHFDQAKVAESQKLFYRKVLRG